MILIFSNEECFLDNIYFLSKNLNQKNIILTKYNEKYFKEAEIIIPTCVISQKKLNQFPQWKHKYLINNNQVYNQLNDKINFYNVIKKYNLLQNSNVKLIDTYDKKYIGSNIYKKYIIKHRNNTVPINNNILTDFINNIITKYSNTHQIQDVLNIKYIHAINCLCYNGKIINGYNFVQLDLKKTHIKKYLKHIESIFINTVSKIIRKFKYNGFIEIKFLEDINKNIYLLEVNPYISKNIKYSTKNGFFPYIQNLIIPYCNIITKSKIKSNTFNIKQLYYNNIKYPKFNIDNQGILKFIEKIFIPYDEIVPYFFHKIMKLNRISYIPIKLQNIDIVINKCKRKSINIIFSFSDEHADFLNNNYSKLKNHNIKFCVPSKDILNCFRDKIKFYNYMKENEFNDYIPKTYDNIIFPCILKLNVSNYGKSTYIINNKMDIPNNIDLNKYLICEIIKGDIEYATHIFAINGNIIIDLTIEHKFDESIFVFGSKKYPKLSNKIKTNTYVLTVFKKLIKKCNYNGIMCIDYKIINNIPKIFEINPRVGASLIRTNNINLFIDKYIEACS